MTIKLFYEVMLENGPKYTEVYWLNILMTLTATILHIWELNTQSKISILSQFYSQISKINVEVTSADLENWAHTLTRMLKCNTKEIFFFCERENAEFQFKDLKSLLHRSADFKISLDSF